MFPSDVFFHHLRASHPVLQELAASRLQVQNAPRVDTPRVDTPRVDTSRMDTPRVDTLRLP